jgi:hypothetical protein
MKMAGQARYNLRHLFLQGLKGTRKTLSETCNDQRTARFAQIHADLSEVLRNAA